jgi:hypothetical protein
MGGALAFGEGDFAGEESLNFTGCPSEEERSVRVDSGGLASDFFAAENDGDFTITQTVKSGPQFQ